LSTSADRARRAALAIGLAAALVLVADLRAVDHLRSARTRCVDGPLPPLSALEVTVTVRTPVLRVGDRARGEALVTNRSTHPVRLLRADAVLVQPGSSAAVGDAGNARFRPVDLGPSTFTTVRFAVHVARCRGGSALAPGFYEVVLLFVEQEGTLVRVRRSAGQAVVLSP